MKRKLTIQIACLFILSIFFNACSERGEEIVSTQHSEDGIPMKLSLGTKALPDNLECDLYLYKKSSSQTNYILSEIIPFGTEDEKYIKFLNTELMGSSYRFLFVATAPGNQEISLGNNTVNKLWTDLTITANQVDLSDNWYYGIVDKTGSQILAEGEINGILERLVGQITLDIFRAEGTVDSPIDIVNKTEIASVLDRVYQIEMQYSDLTKQISFDESGSIVEKDTWETPYLVTIVPEMNDQLQVAIPQTDKGLVISGKETGGSVRIKGVCGLPSTKAVRVASTFYYYDTTPVCQVNAPAHQENHTEACFLKKQLTLNLPQMSEMEELLSVYPNTYTINNAGILFDRIIDIGVAGAVTFDVVWNK